MSRLKFYSRIYIGILSILLSLAGCVNYANMHSTAKPLDSNTLNTPHYYTLQKNSAETHEWWNLFHDAQLNQLIDTALSDSPNLAVAQNRVTEAEQIAHAADAALWPSVNLNTNFSRERYSANILYPPPFGGHSYNQGLIGLNFQYEFDWWGKNRETLAAKLSNADAVAADFAAAKLIITTSVVNAYLQLQYNTAETKIAKQLLTQEQALLDIINDRAKNNITSDIPITTATAQLQNAKLTLERSMQAEQLAEHRLAILIGKNPLTTHITTKPYLEKNYALILPANLPANLLANRPDILAARARVNAAAHEVNAAKARFFPNINLHALLSLQSMQGWNYLFNSNSQDNSVGAAIDLPIFDAGKRRADLGTRYAKYDAAINQYNATILNALRETADQITQLNALRHEKKFQTSSLLATQHNYHLTLSRYHNGINDYVGVIEVHQLLLQQQASMIQLESQYQQAMVGLIKALGGQYYG